MRADVCADLLCDIDVVNCHPELLLQLARRHGADAPALAAYVRAREPTLDAVRRHYGCGREAAKALFLRTINGGGERRWKADFKVAHGVRTHDGLAAFARECLRLRGLLLEKYPRRRAAAARNEWSACAQVLQGFEDDVLAAMEAFFRDAGFDVSVLVFDGLMVRRPRDVTAAVLRAAEARVAVETGFRVRLARKDMRRGRCPFWGAAAAAAEDAAA